MAQSYAFLDNESVGKQRDLYIIASVDVESAGKQRDACINTLVICQWTNFAISGIPSSKKPFPKTNQFSKNTEQFYKELYKSWYG